MSLEILLTEGPNIMGLSKERTAFYVGYQYNPDNELEWYVLEGKKAGTPKFYKFHVGTHGEKLEEAEITKFEYTKESTTINFKLKNKEGKLTISNNSREGEYKLSESSSVIETVYNFFAENEVSLGMKPQDWQEFF